MAQKDAYDVHFCNAWRADVLLKDHYGGISKYSSARNAYNGLYPYFSVKGPRTDIYLRFSERIICGF